MLFNLKVFTIVALTLSWIGQLAFGVAYEGFDYPNDSAPLEDKSGGFGWDGPWTLSERELPGVFTHSQDDTSLSHSGYPFTPVGDRVLAIGPADGLANNNKIDRALAAGFDMGTDGSLYVSYLFQKNGSDSTAGDNQEVDFLGTPLRMGSTSGDEFWLGRSGANNSQPQDPAITFGDTYYIVARIQAVAAGDDLFSMMVFDETESVPTTEPGTWDADYVVGDIADVVTGLRFWIGTNASGAYDELRVGSNWAGVAVPVPEPTSWAIFLIFGLGLGMQRRARR